MLVLEMVADDAIAIGLLRAEAQRMVVWKTRRMVGLVPNREHPALGTQKVSMLGRYIIRLFLVEG